MLGESSSLSRVIECLQEQEVIGVRPTEGQDIEQLHNVTIGLLDKFSDHIDRCKKYNEARIHRKYQNTIRLLEEQNLALHRTLQLEREAIPKSKTYVSDLIDRMVQLRATNDALRGENQVLKQQLSLCQPRQEPQVKRKEAENGELSNESLMVRDAIGKFLRGKKEEGGNLVRFLEFSSSRASKWTLSELFHRLDKWMANMKDTRFIDSQRVRQHLERTCSSVQDTLPPTAIRQTQATSNDGSSLLRLRTENMRSFVNDRLTLVSRRRGGKDFVTSSLKRQGRG